jgi:hypothetical protein
MTAVPLALALGMFALAAQDVARGVIDPRSATPLDAGTMRDYPPTLDHQSGDEQRGFRFDLNRDGHPELIRAYGPKACGTGGCPMEIFDGLTRKVIGLPKGNPLWVFQTMINGWPVLGVYSHGSATSGSLETLVFDGKEYVTVSTVMLNGRDVTELFAKFAAAPRVR